MSKVLIGSNGEALILIRDASERIVDAVTAELRSGTLSASQQVVHSYATGFTDLVAFFESLAHDWRGWDGERRWDSLEGDLSLRAMYQYRHVQLRVTLRGPGPGWGNHGWEASISVTLDPGEQLTQTTAELASLFERY